MSGFAVVKKLQIIEKPFFEKGSFQLIWADKIFKTVCVNIFKRNGYRDNYRYKKKFSQQHY